MALDAGFEPGVPIRGFLEVRSMTDGLCPADPWGRRLVTALEQVRRDYHPLVLSVAPRSAAHSRALREVAEALGTRVVNVNLELGDLLVTMPSTERTVRLAEALHDLLAAGDGEARVLDATEILFEATLGQDPLRLLQSLSRFRPLVAAWPGAVQQGSLVHGWPGHPEFRCYERPQVVLVEAPQ
jgi:hypothetical protein